MEKDLRQDTLDLIIDTINAYKTRVKMNNDLNDKDIYVLKEISLNT